MKNSSLFKKINKICSVIALPIFAFAIAVLNLSLAFDNVMWGDEAFSANTVRGTNIWGVIQRIFYWDAHPPLYYIYLWLFGTSLGQVTPVYHIASLVPFFACLILACTYLKKHFGKLSAWFFVVLTGLSATCIEYNQEVRMYSLLFLLVLVCGIFSYRIITGPKKLTNWIFITLFGVLSAYTNYFAAASTGILLFVTGVYYALKNRKKGWLYGFLSIVSYIVLYIPWMPGLLRQVTSDGNWWRDKPDPFSEVFRFMMFGKRIMPIAVLLVVFGSIFVWAKESDIFKLQETTKPHVIAWKLNKPSVKGWSEELHVIAVFTTVIVLFLCYGYGISYAVSPLMLVRYAYPILPYVLFVLMCVIKRFGEYARESKTADNKGKDSEEPADKVKIVSAYQNFGYRLVYGILGICLGLSLVFGLFDFKYFRSVSRVQDVQTEIILDMIGEPSENTIFDGYGVRHLSWTVLKYYYPDSEILGVAPIDIFEEAEDGDSIEEMWLFLDRTLDQGEVAFFENLGFETELYEDMWLGQYWCDISHVYNK